MTIANEDARTGPYNGNGATTVFAYDFKVTNQAHLVVTLTGANGVNTVQTITTHYTVSGVGDEGGGNITMVTPPATGEQLTITRDVTKTQEVDLQNRGSFLPNTIETAFDKLTQITQDLAELLTRAVKQPVTSTVELTFPAPTGNADKVVGFNAAGTDLEAKTVNSDAYLNAPVSSTDNAAVRFDGTDGTAWQNSGVIIDDNDLVTAPGGFAGSKGADIASATTTVIGTDGDYFDITGTTTITGFTIAAGRWVLLQFDSALTLTHSASLFLPGAANITTATGDRALFYASGTDAVICVGYTKNNGEAVAVDANTMFDNVGATLTAKFTETPISDSSSSGSITIDFSGRSKTTVELTENITSVTVQNLADGDICEVWFRQDATDRTVSGWTHSTATFRWTGGAEPTIVSGADFTTVVQLRYDATADEILGTSTNFGA